MSARTVLVCNHCGREATLKPAANITTTRRTLIKVGWVYYKRGVDYCHACWPTIAAAILDRNKDGYA